MPLRWCNEKWLNSMKQSIFADKTPTCSKFSLSFFQLKIMKFFTPHFLMIKHKRIFFSFTATCDSTISKKCHQTLSKTWSTFIQSFWTKIKLRRLTKTLLVDYRLCGIFISIKTTLRILMPMHLETLPTWNDCK